MNARIICKNIEPNLIAEAFQLGAYQKGEPGINLLQYKLLKKENRIIIEFENQFDFCQLLLLVVDLYEISRGLDRDILGFVDTNSSNQITAYLKDERVCLYLSDELKSNFALAEHEEDYIDIMDIVSASNKNYTINWDTFFSYSSPDKRPFEEPSINPEEYRLLGEGEYLYEKGDFEKEFLEDLEAEK